MLTKISRVKLLFNQLQQKMRHHLPKVDLHGHTSVASIFFLKFTFHLCVWVLAIDGFYLIFNSIAVRLCQHLKRS